MGLRDQIWVDFSEKYDFGTLGEPVTLGDRANPLGVSAGELWITLTAFRASPEHLRLEKLIFNKICVHAQCTMMHEGTQLS